MLTRLCPSCGSQSVSRSHRANPFERFVLPLALLRPFRCLRCDHRLYGYLFARSADNVRQTVPKHRDAGGAR